MTTALSWDGTWSDPFFDGFVPGVPDTVPYKLQASIGDHGYMIDLSKYRRTTLQIRRLGTDDSVEPGESTLSASGVWPRGQDNWFLGAGQEYLDNRFAFESVYVHSGEFPSVRTRYWKSLGIDPWAEGHVRLQPEYISAYTATGTMQTVSCGSYLYWSDGESLYFSNSPTPGHTPGTLVATFNSVITCLTSDGSRVWAATGVNGVYVTNAGSTAATAAATPAALVSPQGLLATQGTGTVNSTNLANGSTAWYVSAVDAFGNETAATSVTATVADVPIELDWNPNTDASSFNVYRQLDPNVGQPYLVTNVDSPTYTDDGSIAGTAQTPPVSNGTGSTAYQATWVLYAKGYLLGSTGRDLVNILASGSVLFIYEHENPGFVWTCGCEIPTAIIVGGYAGGTSFIGAIQPDSNTFGATLAPPTWATVLPPGEAINTIVYSAGSILMGTNEGIRVGTTPDSTGSFEINPVITDPGNCLCMMAWHEFAYFGWSDFDSREVWAPNRDVVSGLGRADLSQFVNQGLPAFATDVMSSITGSVTGCAMINGVPYFVVDNELWAPSGNKVPSAWIEPGWIRYGTLEPKIIVEVDFQSLPMPLGSTINFQIVDERFTVSDIGTQNIAGATTLEDPFSAGLAVGQRFQAIITMTRGTDETLGPDMFSWLSKGVVVPVRQDEILLPIILSTEVATGQASDQFWQYDTLAEFLYLKSLEASGMPIQHTLGKDTHLAYIDQVMVGDTTTTMNDDRSWLNTIVLVKLITLS